MVCAARGEELPTGEDKNATMVSVDRRGKRDSWGKGCSPALEAALQQDTAMRREEMDGKCLGALGSLQSTHLALQWQSWRLRKSLKRSQGKS